MNRLPDRNPQTQVKHEILSSYLDTWGGIIINGLRRQANQQIQYHFIYVDCFAYTGKYLGDQESFRIPHMTKEVVYGSPIIGIRSLDKLAAYATSAGLKVVTNSILIEKDNGNYKDLIITLQDCSYRDRIREDADLFSLKNGEIALMHADATTLGEKLTDYTNRSGVWSFYLIDPYGPSGIPYSFVKKIVQGTRHDVMINFMHEDLVRKAGMAFNLNLEQKYKQLVDHWKNAYGNNIWDEIILTTLEDIREYCYWRDVLGYIPIEDVEETTLLTDEQLASVKERAFVRGYRKVLETMDSEIAIKLIALQFPDKARTMFYLFLTTHDPTGALKLNSIIYDAKFREFELRYKHKILKSTPQGQISFLNPEQTLPKIPKEKRPEIETIANEIFEYFRGRKVIKKDILFYLADSLYFIKEVDKALKYLRKQGKVSFEGSHLRIKTELQFG